MEMWGRAGTDTSVRNMVPLEDEPVRLGLNPKNETRS